MHRDFWSSIFSVPAENGTSGKKNTKLKRLMKDITIQIVVHNNKANLNNSSPIYSRFASVRNTRGWSALFHGSFIWPISPTPWTWPQRSGPIPETLSCSNPIIEQAASKKGYGVDFMIHQRHLKMLTKFVYFLCFLLQNLLKDYQPNHLIRSIFYSKLLTFSYYTLIVFKFDIYFLRNSLDLTIFWEKNMLNIFEKSCQYPAENFKLPYLV